MGAKPINDVLAESLRYYMGGKWTNVALAKRSGVAEATIRNYLSPEKRTTGSRGKEPSAKLTEVAKLAAALGVEVADLVTDKSSEQRLEDLRRRAADHYQRHGVLPEWAPPAGSKPITAEEVLSVMAPAADRPNEARQPGPGRTVESDHGAASAEHGQPQKA